MNFCLQSLLGVMWPMRQIYLHGYVVLHDLIRKNLGSLRMKTKFRT